MFFWSNLIIMLLSLLGLTEEALLDADCLKPFRYQIAILN